MMLFPYAMRYALCAMRFPNHLALYVQPPAPATTRLFPDAPARPKICNQVKDVIFLIIINMRTTKAGKNHQIFELKFLAVESDKLERTQNHCSLSNDNRIRRISVTGSQKLRHYSREVLNRDP
jgi:hypothetical protein